MESNVFTIQMEKKDDVFFLEPLGDVQWGNRACDKQKFITRVKTIRDQPNRYTIFMGDMAENNGPVSRGGPNPTFSIKDLDNEALEIADQQDQVVEILKLIAPKSLGAHRGNHEERTQTEKDFIKGFCRPLGVKYLADAAMTRLKFVHKEKEVASFIILSEHSRLSGKKKGTVMNSMEDLFRLYDADIILAGHTHFKFADEMTRYVWDYSKDTFAEKYVVVANTGSFLKSHVNGYTSYSDMNLGSLRQVGTVTIRFDPYNNKLNQVM